MLYNIAVEDGKPTSVTMFHEGQTYVATGDHQHFAELVQMLTKKNHDDKKLIEKVNVGKVIANKFTQLSERVSLRGDTVYFDGDPFNTKLTELIVQMYYAGGENANWTPLINFFEKVQQNPLEHSRIQAFGWLYDNDFWLAEDGDFIGYKGVEAFRDGFRSKSSGTAFVNGEVHTGKIPTTPGVIVEMPRSEVQHSPSNPCSTGLHVGSWAYASGFANVVLAVKVNPRDVVSVPNDSRGEKMRVCRYRVLGPVTKRQEAELQLGPDHIHKTLNWATGPRSNRGVTSKVKKVATRLSESVRATQAARKAEAKKVAEQKPKRVTTAPMYYDDFKVGDFRNAEFIDFKTLQWLAKEWAIKVPAPRDRNAYEQALSAEATKRRRAAAKNPAANKPLKVIKH